MGVQIARGKVCDQQAVIAALRERRIVGAGLNIFTVESLPPVDPLWAMENVIIAPRIGGMSDSYAHQVLPLLLENLYVSLSGNLKTLRNIVSR